jgi:NAD(P)-dependent dehydrogenase (short-subunit alcohol dehydrogenase family)
VKTAFITGASRGIGRAVALRLASEGSSIAVGFFRNRTKAEAVCGEIEGLGVKALPIKVHVGDLDAVERAFDEVGEVFGTLDVFVSNAASGVLRGLQDVDARGKDIRVNAVSPGVVDTDALTHFPNRDELLRDAISRTPAGRLATPEDVAGCVSFLCSDAAAMIRGHILVVDGGAGLLA